MTRSCTNEICIVLQEIRHEEGIHMTNVGSLAMQKSLSISASRQAS